MLTRLGEHYRLPASPSAVFLFHIGAHRLRIKYVLNLQLSGRSGRSGRSDRQTDSDFPFPKKMMFAKIAPL